MSDKPITADKALDEIRNAIGSDDPLMDARDVCNEVAGILERATKPSVCPNCGGVAPHAPKDENEGGTPDE